MEDSGIVDLYRQRSQQAIVQTDDKYGNYCFSIAWNILTNREEYQAVLDAHVPRPVTLTPVP